MNDANKTATEFRDATNGQFSHTLEKVCVCGHSKGQHAASRTKVDGVTMQECFHEDCAGCDCFKAAKKAK